MHHWFKSYSAFAEWVDFAHWWSCLGKGLRSMGLRRLVFLRHSTVYCTSAAVSPPAGHWCREVTHVGSTASPTQSTAVLAKENTVCCSGVIVHPTSHFPKEEAQQRWHTQFTGPFGITNLWRGKIFTVFSHVVSVKCIF